MRQARLLDAFSMQLNGGLGRFLYYRGRFEEAEDAVGDLDPELHSRQRIQWIRGLVAALAGDRGTPVPPGPR